MKTYGYIKILTFLNKCSKIMDNSIIMPLLALGVNGSYNDANGKISPLILLLHPLTPLFFKSPQFMIYCHK